MQAEQAAIRRIRCMKDKVPILVGGTFAPVRRGVA
jgi:hypothetical protein